jgi:hypothetical protein
MFPANYDYCYTAFDKDFAGYWKTSTPARTTRDNILRQQSFRLGSGWPERMDRQVYAAFSLLELSSEKEYQNTSS